MSEIALEIITKIHADLSDRSGMDWDGIDEDIQQEILDTWMEIIDGVIRNDS